MTSDDSATDAARADDELRAVEALPLAERAGGYDEIGARLRTELERSDAEHEPE